MKKMRQRLFSMLGSGRMLTRAGRVATALLAVAMLTLSVQTAKADTDKLYAKISGTAATLTTNSDGATLVDGSWRTSNKSTITSVTADESCRNFTGTSLANLLYQLSELTTVNLSNLNTENVTDIHMMFEGCEKLTSINFGDGTYFKTDKVTTMAEMFDGCEELTTITGLGGWNTAKVTTMYEMFHKCKKLTQSNLTGISNWNVSSVTTMSSMFSTCSMLTSLDLSAWNVSKVESMSSMFASCNALTSLDLSAWNVSSVTNMSSMFLRCDDLTSLNVSAWDVSKVTTMSSMFEDCSSLVGLDLYGWKTTVLANISNMFENCANLQAIIISNDWDVTSITDATKQQNTFDGCSALKGEQGTTISSITSGSYGIVGGYARYDEGSSNKGLMSHPMLIAEASGATLTLKGTAPTTTGKTFDATSNWFGDASAKAAITSIVVDASCQNATTITSLENLFNGFTAAATITGLNNLNTENVTNMYYVFQDCAAVTLLDLSTWNTKNVHDYSMSGMFWDCTNLKTIIVGDDWQAAASSPMLANCSSLIGDAGVLYHWTSKTSPDTPYAHAGSGGYLTGATRTLTATADGSGTKYWATFFNSAVGYSITGGEAFAGVYNSSTKQVELTSLGTNIPANTPVIICADAATVNMTLDNTIAAYGGTNNLIGIDVQTATPDNSYCLAIGGASNGDLNGKAGFFHFTGSNIPARRAYLTIAAGAPSFIGFGDDETTGLKAIDNGQLTIDNYYDLSGRKIANGKPTQKGLYIVNGKKVVIK